MQKIVYILPEFRKDLGSHFYHKFEFVRRIALSFETFLIIEKGERPDGVSKFYIQRFRWLPLRALELFCVLLVLRFKGYRIIWTHYSFLAGIIAPFFGKSFYWNCGMPWLYSRSPWEEFFFRLALRRSILVTGTEGLRGLYIKYYGLKEEKVRVLPNSIKLERFSEWRGRQDEARKKLGIEEDKKVVLFLHRLSKRKGADIIMPVAMEFLGDPDVIFLVAGKGPLEEVIQGANIRKVGEISQKEVPLYFAASDVFFMPSEEEGFPHVILEAMAVGVPIVAAEVGGVVEILPKSLEKLLVHDQNPKLYIKNIKKALTFTLSQEEPNAVGQYDIESVVPMFINLIQR